MRTSLVTGASGGVGAALATSLGARREHVWLCGRDAERLDAVATAVEAAGGKASTFTGDLADDATVRDLATVVTSGTTALTGIVHAVGEVLAARPVALTDASDLDRQFAVNFRAVALVTRALLPLLIAGEGDLVVVNSTAATRGVAGSSAYAASKAALRSFTDSLRDEVNSEGVRVLSVMLGRTASAMQEVVHRAEGREYDASWLVKPDDVAAMVTAALALPRTAEVTELTLRPARRPPQ